MLTVKHLFRWKGSDLWTISSLATAFEALQLMAEKNIGALPVVDQGRLVGMFSERDYARKVILRGKSSKSTLVKELMTTKVYWVKPSRSVEDCMFLMTEKRIRHLPVMDNQQLIGIITIGDVVKAMISQQQSTIQDLQNYITGATY
ncbi:MAG: CBS domain-containing protein [Bacteroidota bacterium]